jgi:hypothetical protein
VASNRGTPDPKKVRSLTIVQRGALEMLVHWGVYPAGTPWSIHAALTRRGFATVRDGHPVATPHGRRMLRSSPWAS